MKTIITLLFSLGVFATSFAQDNYRQTARDDRYVYNQRIHFDRGNFAWEQKQFQIDRINHEVDFKIRAIENDYTLRRHQKKVAIRNVERERIREMQMVNARFNGRYERHHNWQY